MGESVERGRPFLPFAAPALGDEEVAAVAEVIRSGWLTTGPKARAFERAFAAFLGGDGGEEALAVNSATAGLHLGLEALGIGPGDAVVTTPFTFTATAEVIRYLGADPVFVDIDEHTLNIDPGEIARALAARRVRAVIPMHYGGLACDMDAIMTLARGAGASVMPDAAHALPATHRGRMVGTLDDDV
ncbi:MAG: aminotransferase class I/II-fold pyridoxal phosphate-dependent enzyme, partial [Gemmatimonadaceae bacterium]